MNCSRVPLLFAILFAFVVSSTMADNLGGSGYSRYGFGDISYFGTGRNFGMGGAGLSLLSTNEIDRMNPAATARITTTQFSATGLYEGYSTSDATNSTFLSRTTLQGTMIAVPLATDHGIVLSAGVSPYSRVNYNILTPITQGGLGYTLQYTGFGGLSRAQLGLSFAPASDLAFGARFNYYFGAINNTIKQTFSTTDFTSSDVVRSTRFSGIGMTFGGIYSGLGKVLDLGEKNLLSVGAVVSTTSYLSTIGERYYTFRTGTVTTLDTTTSAEETTRLPYSIAAGASLVTEQFIIASDYSYQHWNQYSVNGIPSTDLRDSYRLSIGGELLPKRDAAAPFTQRVAYRLGFFYDASYYNIRNEPINEMGFTAGFGLPVFAETRLNIGASYSFRGTTDKQLQKDRILRVSFGVNINELWFIHPKEE